MLSTNKANKQKAGDTLFCNSHHHHHHNHKIIFTRDGDNTQKFFFQFRTHTIQPVYVVEVYNKWSIQQHYDNRPHAIALMNE
jgi:hypothetical protein